MPPYVKKKGTYGADQIEKEGAFVTNSRAKQQLTLSVQKHAHPPRVFTALYTQHLLDSKSFEFEICILQRHSICHLYVAPTYFPREAITSHYFPLREDSERLVPSLGLGTTWVWQLRSGSCHHPTAATKCNVQPSKATANPVGEKACSSTKGGLLRYIVNTYSIHKVLSLKYAYYSGTQYATNTVQRIFQGRLSRHTLRADRTVKVVPLELTELGKIGAFRKSGCF